MSKHTAGPWNIDNSMERRGPSGHILSIRVQKESSGAIADTYANCLVKTEEECRANAHLISAAPAILAALETLCTLRNEDSTTEWNEAFKAGHRAIAKARGEKAPIFR